MKTKIKDFLKKENIKEILVNKYFIIFILIPFVKPANEITGIFDNILDIWKILNCLIIFSLYLYIKRKPSTIVVMISMLQIIFILSTILSSGKIWWVLVQTISIIAISAFCDLVLSISTKKTLLGFSIITTIMCVLTIISMFVFYPNGMYVVNHNNTYLETSNYLWGFDNSSAFKFISTLTILTLLKATFKNKKIDIICLIVCFLSLVAFLYVKSIMAALGCLILFIYNLIIVKKEYKFKFLNFRNVLIIVILSFSIVFLFKENLNILQKIAQETDKVASLNHRFAIWDNSISNLKNRPIIGYGFEAPEVISEKLGIDHPHNIFLDIAYRGGILGIGVFIITLIIIGKKMMKNPRNIYSNIISIGLFAFLIMAQMDYYNDLYLIFILWVLAYNVDLIQTKEKKTITR